MNARKVYDLGAFTVCKTEELALNVSFLNSQITYDNGSQSISGFSNVVITEAQAQVYYSKKGETGYKTGVSEFERLDSRMILRIGTNENEPRGFYKFLIILTMPSGVEVGFVFCVDFVDSIWYIHEETEVEDENGVFLPVYYTIRPNPLARSQFYTNRTILGNAIGFGGDSAWMLGILTIDTANYRQFIDKINKLPIEDEVSLDYDIYYAFLNTRLQLNVSFCGIKNLSNLLSFRRILKTASPTDIFALTAGEPFIITPWFVSNEYYDDSLTGAANLNVAQPMIVTGMYSNLLFETEFFPYNLAISE